MISSPASVRGSSWACATNPGGRRARCERCLNARARPRPRALRTTPQRTCVSSPWRIFDAAIRISGYRETVPEKISDTLVKIPALPRSVTPLSEGTSALQAAVVTVKIEGAHGSGFFISKDGYLLTNHHVVTENKFVTVKLTTGRELPGEVLQTNKTRDIALVKVNESGMVALP